MGGYGGSGRVHRIRNIRSHSQSAAHIFHIQFDFGLAVEGNICTSSSNSSFAIVVHVELVLVGVVFGIGPGDRLGSIAFRVVDVEVDSGTSGLIIIVDLTLYSPGSPDKEVLIVPW